MIQDVEVDLSCSWDCHGLPVEHEIDKAFGKTLHQWCHLCMHALTITAATYQAGEISRRWNSVVHVQASTPAATSSPWALINTTRSAGAL